MRIILCGCFKTFDGAGLLSPVAAFAERQIGLAVVDAVQFEQREHGCRRVLGDEVERLPRCSVIGCESVQ